MEVLENHYWSRRNLLLWGFLGMYFLIGVRGLVSVNLGTTVLEDIGSHFSLTVR